MPIAKRGATAIHGKIRKTRAERPLPSRVTRFPVEGITSTAHAANADVLAGGYVGTQATVKLSKALNVFAGIQFQSSESYQLNAGSKQAEIDLRQELYFSAGLSCSF